MAKKQTSTQTKRYKRTAKVNKFVVNRAAQAAFKGEGLRPFFVYRDLKLKGATGGRIGAHVIRATRACAEGTGQHKHRLSFQFVYVLKGRVKFWYEGQGLVALGPGDAVHMPPGIVHELVEGSADLELIEITAPADFATIDVPKTKPAATARSKPLPRAKAA